MSGQSVNLLCSCADLDLSGVNPYWMHIFCQLLTAALLESVERENGLRNYFMIGLHESNVAGLRLGLKLVISGSKARHTVDCPSRPSITNVIITAMYVVDMFKRQKNNNPTIKADRFTFPQQLFKTQTYYRDLYEACRVFFSLCGKQLDLVRN